ncbi:hypothetical protein JOB18_029978 [Solea senegalensis]|uniref:Uncharacterized protein n=1 Tax=Solea senegalensis TaxID=28829 RepID=A0AAV6SMU7_SOLSE|nr:hypothetical protein JOB18_029978 [Solea senegalensis]
MVAVHLHHTGGGLGKELFRPPTPNQKGLLIKGYREETTSFISLLIRLPPTHFLKRSNSAALVVLVAEERARGGIISTFSSGQDCGISAGITFSKNTRCQLRT